MQNQIREFTDLLAWKEGHKIVLEVYRITQNFPNSEMFGLVSQMRRCSVSFTSNIAEGFARFSYADKIRFYIMARGSINELHNQLIISRDLKYIQSDDFQRMLGLIKNSELILNGLIRSSREKV